MGSANLRKMRDTEINSFFPLIKKYWKPTREFEDVKGNSVEVSYQSLRGFLREVLSAHKCNVMVSIGSHITSCMFKIDLNLKIDDPIFLKICRDIWCKPEKYYNFNKGEDTFSGFLRHLYVRGSGYKEECSLCDFLKERESQIK